MATRSVMHVRRIQLLSLVALGLGLHLGVRAQQPAQRTLEDERARWNRIFTTPPARIRTDANQFLVQVTHDLKPGTALDVGMGLGRNALFLARKGWTVTGIDISDVGVDNARRQAAVERLPLTAIRQDMFTFDFGRERYDLIAFMYMGPLTQDLADRMTAALKPGGLLVMEHFTGGMQPDLPKHFPGLDVLRHAEEEGSPDYDQYKPGRVTRFLARKTSHQRNGAAYMLTSDGVQGYGISSLDDLYPPQHPPALKHDEML
jgi:SAM-dependent methyltransferase